MWPGPTLFNSNGSATRCWSIWPAITNSANMFAADRASWQNPRILVLLLLIFLCGALAGALTMRAGLHEKLHRGTSYWRDGKTPFFSYGKLGKGPDLTAEKTPRPQTNL